MIRTNGLFVSVLSKWLYLAISIPSLALIISGCSEKEESGRQQLRSVSAIYDELDKALIRFNTQHNDIGKQHNLFKRKNTEFGYIGTQHGRRIAHKELKDINTNVIQQCNMLKEWNHELISYTARQIRSVSWNNNNERQKAETKYQQMIKPMQTKILDIEQCLYYHENFNFRRLEKPIERR